MMPKFSSKVLIVSSVVLALGFITGTYVFAAYSIEKAKQLNYPIVELGSCKNFEECKAYCNKDENIPKCNRFSIKNGLLTKEEAADTERLISLMDEAGGPGKCQNSIECFSYCESAAHLDECWDYTQRHNLAPGMDLETVRRLAKLARDGAQFPGNCQGHSECKAYCDIPSHMRECVSFGEKAGLISKEEAEEAKKIVPLLERGEKTPGNCGRKAACETYCTEAAHLDECIAFAEKAGLIPPEELADAKKFAPFIKNGETPGQCKRKLECEQYCSDTAHFEECVAFAQRAGMMSKEDAELAKKLKGAGPGGCKSRGECEQFCSDPANQDTCINFAKEHGLVEGIAEVETKVRGEVESKMRVCAEKPCAELISCLQSLQSGKGEEKSPSGTASLPADIQGKLNSCIEEIKAKAIKESNGGKIPFNSGEAEQQRGDEESRQYDEQYKKQHKEEYKKQYEEQFKSQVDCSLFAAAPKCEYAGAPGSQNYNLCKQCFPDR